RRPTREAAHAHPSIHRARIRPSASSRRDGPLRRNELALRLSAVDDARRRANRRTRIIGGAFRRRQMSTIQAGILGIGVYLPETVRRNDWWPAHVVAKWKEKALHRVDNVPIPRTPGVEAALAAMNELREDPFNGAVERRVMADDQ